MTLPAPNLDDRRFQELVDEAKRLVQQRCPEWTDHNLSDPGVTLIELFAWMTDQVVYRLNRVPDRNYVKFLELIGVRLFPPVAARTGVTFWLSAPQADTVRIPAGTEVATRRVGNEEAVSFTTTEDLPIPPCQLTALGSSIAEGEVRDHLAGIESGQGFFCFDQVPKPGDTLLVGLSNAVPSCAVGLRFDCEIEGLGVDPRRPPLTWEAWTGDTWERCELDRDGTGGLNRAGDVVLHVPPDHVVSVISAQRAGWLRCRVVETVEGQPAYGASPKVTGLSTFTMGGTAQTTHAEAIQGEILGVSEGVPGQRYSLKHLPVVAADGARVLEVGGEDGWQEWTEVPHFAESDPESLHFVLDAAGGEVLLGPAVRERDGSLRKYGAVPPKGAILRLRSYATGGGHRGNVARGALSILKSSIPYISTVENRHPARGGVDGEDLENAKVRGPLALRTGGRAVTTEDYEALAREVAPDTARIRCVETAAPEDSGVARVLVVPAATEEDGRIRFDQLVPSEELVRRIAAYLDERRVIGSRVVVEPALFQGVTIVAKILARPRTSAERLEAEARNALYDYFNPVRGGPDGGGWPFGRTVHVGEVYAVLQRLKGTELVEEARLYAADPRTGERGKAVQSISIPSNSLVFSYEHQVLVEEPGGPGI
jgi:predicted phage baseplate assembly protein